MNVALPDPDPGRCSNYRTGKDAYGEPRSKRCLDYEGHDSRCRFPDDPKPVSIMAHLQSYQGSTAAPKPWVSPLDEEEGRKATPFKVTNIVRQ